MLFKFRVILMVRRGACAFAVIDCNTDLASSGQLKSGTIASLRYGSPAGYPSPVVCRYRFFGDDRERVRVVFTDFDLSYPHGDPTRAKE